MRMIVQALQKGDEALKNGKRLLPEAADKDRLESIRTHEYYKPLLESLNRQCAEWRDKPLPALRFTDREFFFHTGERFSFEKQYFDMRGRLAGFAMRALVYGEPGDIRELEDTIWAICEETTWCVPAHSWARNEALVLPASSYDDDTGEYRLKKRTSAEMIDLFSAETGFALSEILYLLGDKLSPEITARMREKIMERTINAFMQFGKIFHWEILTMNWSAVCAGSVGASAIYMLKESELLAPVILRVVNAMGAFLEGYNDDGACLEGIGYWTYGFGFFIHFAALLYERTDGALDMFALPKVKEIAHYQERVFIGGNAVASFADASPHATYVDGLAHYLKQHFPDISIPAPEYRALFGNDSCYRFAMLTRDLFWTNPNCTRSALAPMTHYFNDSEIISTRQNVRGATVGFAAKCGSNQEPHNHNDVGTFVYAIDGVHFLTDLGAGEYTKEYFGEKRYEHLATGSQGHSLPIIDSRYQIPHGTHKGTVITSTISDALIEFTADIAPVYEYAPLTSCVRRYRFSTADARLEISDTVSAKTPLSFTDRFVTMIKPVKKNDGIIEIHEGRHTVTLRYPHEICNATISQDVFHNQKAIDHMCYFIDFSLKKKITEGTFCFTIEFE
ncbi:MAG: heparinase II/III family protein [Kiritimatiellales bacterium]|nr:heparinase II/III family protein [Kiritimatiellales bacterium]